MGPQLRRDLSVNLVMSLVATVAMLLALREAARLLTPLALGTLLLARRLADLWANLVQAGTPHAIRRYLPLAAQPQRQRRWLWASLLLSGGVSLLFLAVAWLGRQWLAPFSLGSQPEGPALLVSTALLAIATAVTNMAMSALIARRHFVLMNLLQVLNGSGWLLGALWIGLALSPNALVGVQAGGGLTLALLVLAAILASLRGAAPPDPESFAPYLRETAAYGISRTISPFLEILLLVVGPWLLRDDPAFAGGLILAFTLLRLTSVLVQPLGMVGSVTGAQLVGAQDEARLSRGINLVVGGSAGLGALLCAAGYAWIDPGLRLWLGQSPALPIVERFAAVILLAMAPYLLFQGLKPVIEAVWREPWVLYIVLASLVLLIIGHGILTRVFDPVTSLLVMIPLALATSGVGTLLVVRKLLRPWAWFGGSYILLATGLILGLNLLVARLVADLPLAAQLGAALLTGVLTFGGGLWALLTAFPSPCLIELVRFLFPRLLPSLPAEHAGTA